VEILETDRLSLRRLIVEDAGFILRLVNEPSWLRFIGDKGVRTLEDARNYILNGPMESYERRGFGLYMTELKGQGIPIGMCGLIKRDALEDVDLGFAYLPEFWRRGLGYEAASAVIAYAGATLGLERLLAITSPDNDGSIGLLEKLGFRYVRMVRLTEESPEARLFSRDLV
jgi:RimJ/RimL family protein N-acetyltransferase